MDDGTKTSESLNSFDESSRNLSSESKQISSNTFNLSDEPLNHALTCETEIVPKANSSLITDSDNLLITTTSSLIQYDRDTLLRLRKSHSAELWPAALHRSHVGGDGLWDPVKSFDLTRAITPPERRRGGGGLLSNTQDERKRGGSSSERSRDDGIVLGPQKRSWASGCSSSFRGSAGVASGSFSGSSVTPSNTASNNSTTTSDSSRGTSASVIRPRVSSSSGSSARTVENRRGNSNSFSRGDEHDDRDTVRYDSRTNATGGGRSRGGHREILQSRGAGRFDNLPRGNGASGRNRSERDSWGRSGGRQSNGRYEGGGGFEDALPEWATCEGGPRDQYDTMEFQALPDDVESSDKNENSGAVHKSKGKREDRVPARRVAISRAPDKSVNGSDNKKTSNVVPNSESSVVTPLVDMEKKEPVSNVNAELMDIDISDILPSGNGDKLGGNDEALNVLSDSKEKNITPAEISSSSGYSRFSKWKATVENNNSVSSTGTSTSTVTTSNAEQCAQIQKFIMKEINSGSSFSRNESSQSFTTSSIPSRSAIDSNSSAVSSENSVGSRLLINILQNHSTAPSYSSSSKRTLSPSETNTVQMAPGYSMDTKTMEANLRDLLLPSDRNSVTTGASSITNSFHQKLGLSRAAAINGQVRTLEEIESSYLKQQAPSHSQQGPPGLMNGNDASKLMSLQIPAQSGPTVYPQKIGGITPLSPSQSQQLSPSFSQQTQVKPPQSQMPIDQLQRFLMMRMANNNPNMMMALAAQRIAMVAQQSGLPPSASSQNVGNAAAIALGMSQSGGPSAGSFSSGPHNPAAGALHAAQFYAAASPANNAGIGNRLLNSQAHQPDANSLLQHLMAKQQMQNSAAAAAAAAAVNSASAIGSSRQSTAAFEEQFRNQNLQQQFLAQLRGAAPAASGDQQLAANLSKQLNLDKPSIPRGSGSETTPFTPRPIVKTDEDDTQMSALRRRTQEVLSAGGLTLSPVGSSSAVRPMLGGMRSVGPGPSNVSVGPASTSNATKNQVIQQQQQQLLALMQAKAILHQHQGSSPHQTAAVMQQMLSAATSTNNAAAALRHHQLQQFASQHQQQLVAATGVTESDPPSTAASASTAVSSSLSRFLGMDSLRHQRDMPPLPSSDKAVTLDQVESR